MYEFKTDTDIRVISPIITRFEGINMPQMITKKELQFQNAPSVHISYSALAASQNRYIILSGALKRTTMEDYRISPAFFGARSVEPEDQPYGNNLCFLFDTENFECQKLPDLISNDN